MMRSLYRRDSALMRVVSTLVALAFTLSLAGSGFAAPAPTDGSEAAAIQAPAEQAPSEASAKAPAEDEDPAPDSSKEAAPVTPKPDEDPAADATDKSDDQEAPESGGTKAFDPTAEPARAVGSIKIAKKSAASHRAPAVSIAGKTPPEIAPVSADVTFSQVDWNAWRVSPNTGWVKANLGAYHEGDLVPFRITMDNTGKASASVVPSFAIALDALSTNSKNLPGSKGSIDIDWAEDFRFEVVDSLDDGPGGGSSLPGMSASSNALDSHIRVSYVSDGSKSIPAGKYGVIYFKAHLAVTAKWWMQNYEGASGYPGSSGQAEWISWDGEQTAGAKTISLPSVRIPDSSITGFKFDDVNEDKDPSGEPRLAGWEFTLDYLGESSAGATQFSLKTKSAGDDGSFAFANLPAGYYRLSETMQSGWEASTGESICFFLNPAQDVVKPFGNHRVGVTKTFKLNVADAASDHVAAYKVYWTSDKGSGSAEMTYVSSSGGVGTWCASTSVPYGTTLTSWGVSAVLAASLGGEEVRLGGATDLAEVLKADKCDVFDFDPASISGTKSYAVGDGTIRPDRAWNISLYRNGVLYAGPVQTGDDGSYSFLGLLPGGEYEVRETVQSGFAQVSAPATFTVSGSVESAVADHIVAVAAATGAFSKDFINKALAGAIKVTKTPSATTVHAGDAVSYTICIQNTGQLPVTLSHLVDPMFSDTLAGGVYSFDPPVTLAPGEKTQVVLGPKTLAEPGMVENTVIAYGKTAVGSDVSASASAKVLVIAPALQVTKLVGVAGSAPSAAIDVAPNTSVTYAYTIHNGGTSELTIDSIVDNKLDLSALAVPSLALPVKLGAGEDLKFTATTAVASSVINTVTVTAHDELNSEIVGQAKACVEVLPASMKVAKFASASRVRAGTPIHFWATVDNDGQVPFTVDSVTDPLLGTIDFSPTVVEPGKSITVDLGTKSFAEVGHYTNVVTVNATPALGTLEPQSAWVSFDVCDTSVIVTKKVNGQDEASVSPGAMVTYTYKVENKGTTQVTLSSIVDDKLDLATLATPAFELPVALMPRDVLTFSASAKITTDTVNVFRIKGTDCLGGAVDECADAVVRLVVDPRIAVDKTASAAKVGPNGSVTYTYVVRNAGDVGLKGVQLMDDKLGNVGNSASLAVGEVATFTASTTLSVATTNTVTATAHDDYGHAVSATDTAFVDVAHPGIDIVKTASPAFPLDGESVTYTYTVTNNGDIGLAPVVVIDDKLGTIGTIASLGVGQTAVLTASITASADVTNIGTATGTFPGGTVSDSDSESIDVVHPAISVDKVASPTSVVTSGTVAYTYTVRNSGDVLLANVQLVDDKLGMVGTAPSLAVGASMTFLANADISVPTTNTVVATGTDAYGHRVSASDTAFVDVALPFTPPDLAIVKSADVTSTARGEIVTYTLTYSDVAAGTSASGVTITDDFDERYMTVVDANGGTVADGKITWNIPGTLTDLDGERTVSYKLRVNLDVPESVTSVTNTAVVSSAQFDSNMANNTSSYTVVLLEGSEEQPEVPSEESSETSGSLPFTGGPLVPLFIAAVFALLAGAALRRMGRDS